MKQIPVVRSKLTMPQLPKSVIRTERANHLIQYFADKSAVMINAPSGYGKTTLMITAFSALKGNKNRICWYRLEQEDRDLSVFYAYVTEALFPCEDPQWQDTRTMLESFGEYQTQYRYMNAIICQELWAYCNRHPDLKTTIVFDDLQNVKDSAEISESISYFICNVPNQCQVFVSSREQINVLSEKQKLDKNIAEIHQEDLCFMEKEISEFLAKTFKTSVDRKLVRKIHNSTEGWIAGVIMVCQIISDFGIVEAENLLKKSWQKSKLFQYIASEVLKVIEKELMQFLVKAAILQDFTSEDANEILEIQNTGHLILLCEKKGLFIQRIIRDNITFRFHSLFRDALLQLQPEYMAAEEIKSLNLKAASYYISHRIFDRAIEHFIVCGDINSAVELITRESVTLITFEAVEQLRVWFNLLPEEVLEQNPSLLYIKSFTYHQGSSSQPMLLMEKAAVKFRENGDALMQVNALMTLTNYGMLTSRSDYTLKYLPQAMETLETYEHESPDKFMTKVFSLIHAITVENFSCAFDIAGNVRGIAMPEDWKWLVCFYSSMMGCATGDLDFAEKEIRKTFELELVKRAVLFKAFALTYLSNVLYIKNDIPGLAAIEGELWESGEKYEFNYMLGYGKRASAYRKYVQHDLDTAVELLEMSISHFEQFGNRAMASLNNLCLLLWLSRRKKSVKLLQEAANYYQALTLSRSGYCLKEIGQSILGAIARECGEFKLAEEHLSASAQASEKKGAKQILSGTCLHLAKLYFDTGLPEKAEYYLEKSLSVAAYNKYSIFWDIHLPTLTEMLLRCVKAGIFPEYVKELLERYFKHEGVLYIERNIGMASNESLQEFSDVVLGKFNIQSNTDLSCTIDVHLFGRFTIAVNGIQIPDEEWKTKKIKGVLEYLLLNKGKIVLRDQLMEVFWPDSDKKSASVSLRAALYELKKVLGKYGVRNDGDTPFICEKTGSLEIKPNNMLTVDMDEFLVLHDKYVKQRKSDASEKGLIPLLERMNGIYSDDLLSEELYADWTFTDREVSKSIFLDTAATLASLYALQKDTHTAEKLLHKVLYVDPYNEQVCLKLLALYVSKAQRSRAVKLYSEFEKRLMKDLNIKPDPRLSRMINNNMS
jgi:DNA-binding SARP family transcriptional activator